MGAAAAGLVPLEGTHLSVKGKKRRCLENFLSHSIVPVISSGYKHP